MPRRIAVPLPLRDHRVITETSARERRLTMSPKHRLGWHTPNRSTSSAGRRTNSRTCENVRFALARIRVCPLGSAGVRCHGLPNWLPGWRRHVGLSSPSNRSDRTGASIVGAEVTLRRVSRCRAVTTPTVASLRACSPNHRRQGGGRFAHDRHRTALPPSASPNSAPTLLPRELVALAGSSRNHGPTCGGFVAFIPVTSPNSL